MALPLDAGIPASTTELLVKGDFVGYMGSLNNDLLKILSAISRGRAHFEDGLITVSREISATKRDQKEERKKNAKRGKRMKKELPKLEKSKAIEALKHFGIEPVKFDFKYHEFKVGQNFSRPCLRTGDNKIDLAAMPMCAVNSDLRLDTWVTSVAWASRLSRERGVMLDPYYLGVLRYYLEERFKVGDALERQLSKDMYLAKRTALVLNAVVLDASVAMYDYERLRPVLREVFDFLFNEGDDGNTLVKKSTVITIYAFSRSQKGHNCRMPVREVDGQMVVGQYVDTKIEEMLGRKNDEELFALVKGDFDEEVSSLKEGGLPLLAGLIEYLLSADVVRENLFAVTFVSTLASLMGYIASDEWTSLKEAHMNPNFGDGDHMIKDVKVKLNGKPQDMKIIDMRESKYDELYGDTPLSRKLEDKWFQMMTNPAMRLLSEKRILEIIPSQLTSNSAGLVDSGKVTFEYDERRFSSNSKKAQFYYNPDEFVWNYKPGLIVGMGGVKWEDIEISSAGQLGIRTVAGGKATRWIHPIRLNTYVSELTYAVPIYRWMTVGPKKAQYTFDSTGEMTIDMATSFAASSDPSMINLSLDFKYYDTSQGWALRMAAMRGFTRAVDSRQIDAMFFGRKFSRLFQEIYESTRGELLWRRSPTGVIGIVTRGALKSGEKLTTASNNLTSESFTDCLLDNVSLVARGLQPVDKQFQGDDTRIVFLSANENPVDDCKKVLESISDLSKRTGLAVSALKSGLRAFFTSFLKKQFIYGHYVPYLQVQLFSKEREREVGDNFQILQSLSPVMSTIASRGGNHNFLYDLLICTCCLSANILSSSFEDGKQKVGGAVRSKLVYLGAEFAFVPVSLGGGGNMFGSLLGANRDILICHLCKQDKALLASLNRIARVLKIPRSRMVEKTIDDIVSGIGTTIDGKPANVFEKGMRFLRSIQNFRAETESREAFDVLKTRVGDKSWISSRMAYFSLPIRELTKGVESSAGIVELKDEVRVKALQRSSIPNALKSQKDLIGSLFPMLMNFSMSIGDKLEFKRVHHPLAFLSGPMDNVVCSLGFRLNGSGTQRPVSSLINILRRSETFPADVTPEMLNRMLAHPEMMDVTNRALLFVMLGAEAGVAQQAANSYNSLVDTMAIAASEGFSLNDNVLAFCDMSETAMLRLVDHNITIGPKTIIRAYASIAMLFALSMLVRTGELFVIKTSASSLEVRKTVENMVMIDKALGKFANFVAS